METIIIVGLHDEKPTFEDTDETVNRIDIFDKNGKEAILLDSREGGNRVDGFLNKQVETGSEIKHQ